ncbi:hypothetical protein D3C72_2201960 [compost metagenome]
MNLDLFLHTGDAALDTVELSVGGFDLLVHQLLALLLDAFAGLHQLLEIVDALGAGLGVGTQASQPDLAGVELDVSEDGGLAFYFLDFLLDGYFGHGAPHAEW